VVISILKPTPVSSTSDTTHIKLKMLVAAEDVARRAVNVAYVGDKTLPSCYRSSQCSHFRGFTSTDVRATSVILGLLLNAKAFSNEQTPQI